MGSGRPTDPNRIRTAGSLDAIRSLALPVLAAAGVAWVLARGKGPLLSFTYSHGKIAGLAVVGLAGLGVLLVFYIVYFFTGLNAGERLRGAAWLRTKVARSSPHDGGES